MVLELKRQGLGVERRRGCVLGELERLRKLKLGRLRKPKLGIQGLQHNQHDVQHMQHGVQELMDGQDHKCLLEFRPLHLQKRELRKQQ